MRKHKKEKRRGSMHNLQNCVGVIQQPETKIEIPKEAVAKEDLEALSPHDDLESADIRVDSILSDGDVELKENLFRVEIPRNVYYKLLTYSKLLDDEISGLGYVERIGTNAFKVSDIYLLKQKVSSVTCDLDIEDQCRLMQELIAQGKNPSNLKFWWHSHAKMGASWSTQDEKTGKSTVCDYYISLVINHSGEMRCRINIYQPIELEIDNVKVVMVDSEEMKDMIKSCQEEIKQKVFKEKSRTGFTSVRDWRDEHAYRYGNYNNNASVGDSKPSTQKELFNVDDERRVSEELNEMQLQFFGNHFTVGDYSFVWDEEVKMYNVHGKDNKKLTMDEVEKLGLMKYADPKYFDNDANEDVTLTEKDRTIVFSGEKK